MLVSAQDLRLTLLLDHNPMGKAESHSLFTPDVLCDDDYAQVASLLGDVKKGEVWLRMTSQFNSDEYLAKAKSHIKKINSAVAFLDESSTINVDRILEKMLTCYDLLDEEVALFKKYPKVLLEMYFDVQEKMVSEIPSSYIYSMKRSNYPFNQVWETLYEILKN